MANENPLTTLNRYELLEKLGEGGFGVVYRGRDPMLERLVAIKELRADLTSDLDYIERFRREARLAASLRHPNIVTVIEVGEQDGRYYLVMDYLPGGSLKDRLEGGKPLPMAQVVELLRPLAEALDYAHAKGVIHRDVKPSNVLFGEDGRPVLTDFGLVKSTKERSTTTTGKVLGTPEYMAPEQIQGGETSPATDLYALGVIAYQMFTGRVPFSGSTPYEIQSGHVNQPPPDPHQLNPALPEETATILLRALAKQPGERYPSGQAFVAALQGVVAQAINQQARSLLIAAQAQMASLDFVAALASLEQAQAIQSMAETARLIQECQRRQAVWNGVQELQAQQEQVERHLAEISASEDWINTAGIKASRSGFPAPALHPGFLISGIGLIGLLLIGVEILQETSKGSFSYETTKGLTRHELGNLWILAGTLGLMVAGSIIWGYTARKNQDDNFKKGFSSGNLAIAICAIGGLGLLLIVKVMVQDLFWPVRYYAEWDYLLPFSFHEKTNYWLLALMIITTIAGIFLWVKSLRKVD